MSSRRPRLLFIADARAENFRRWIRYFVEQGDELYVLSTYSCDNITGAMLSVLPGIMRASSAIVKRSDALDQSPRIGMLTNMVLRRGWDRRLYPLWGTAKLLNLPFQIWRACRLIEQVNPDAVIAFRTQNEGHIAALTNYHPLILFTQGQDFVYQARELIFQSKMTALSVQRVDALMADCERDIQLARCYGLKPDSPVGVFPGNGGVDTSVYAPGRDANQRRRMIVFPRGFAPYIRFDTLLSGIRLLHQKAAYDDVEFVLLVTPSVIKMAERMLQYNGLNRDLVHIKRFLSQSELAALLQSSAAIVSPSQTDGTPNSMLEAMACGAFPIMSDLQSVREWVQHRKNGLLFDPLRPDQLAYCMELAIEDVAMRQRAQEQNLRLIREHADYRVMMPAARDFVLNLANSWHRAGLNKSSPAK